MRKRNCKYRGVKLCSCNGMELIRYAFVVCLVALVASCRNASPKEMPESPSRNVCCDEYIPSEKYVVLTEQPQPYVKTKKTKIQQTQWKRIEH